MRGHEPEPEKKKVEYTQTDLYPGAKVHLKERDLFGEVLEIKGSSIMVAFGQMITTVSRKDVEMISQPEFEKITGRTKNSSSFSGVDLQERRLNFSPSIDLRGVRGDEAMSRLQSFIDEAVMLGEKNLRILHGKGNGILRQMTRDFLATIDVVKSYKDEDIRLGGSGITIVVLDF